VTVDEFFLAESKKRKKDTGAQWRYMLNHIRAVKLDGIGMNHLNGDHCIKFRDYLADLVARKQLGKFTSHNYLSIFRTGLRAAYRAKLTKENLVDRFNQLPSGQSTRQYLTQEELDRFSVTPTRSTVSRDVFLFSALAGMRISDIRALTWEMVFDSVVRDAAGVEREVSELRYTMRKTGRAHVLPLGVQARRMLGQRGTGLVWKWLPDHSTLSGNIRRLALRAGIDKVITMHCARHTCATLLLSKGVALKTVSQILGHSSVRTTEIYAKVLESSTRSAVDLMSFDGPVEFPKLRLVK
jgi:site-specific recombinase XerD